MSIMTRYRQQYSYGKFDKDCASAGARNPIWSTKRRSLISVLVQELLELWVEIQQGAEPEILIAKFSAIQNSKKLER